MNIKKFAVLPTGRLHLRDANDTLMYADNENGDGVDKSKPMAVNLYGPGSKQHAAATTKQSNSFLSKLRRKGKSDQSTEERLQEQAEYLAECTASWENMAYGDDELDDKGLSLVIYADPEVGFVADQVAAYLKEWGNFTKPSTKN